MKTDIASLPVCSADRGLLIALDKQIRQREKRGLPVDRMRDKRERLFRESNARYEARLTALPKPKLDADLPVLAAKDRLLELIGKHQVVIVSGETGSGKTTQLPQLCLELGLGARGMIAHTQPRRIAARSVAERIAEELAVPLGADVGYQVRFDEKTSDNTVIKLMTDGMLLAETLSDPYLSRYEVIIVDEAHERSLNIDFLLGYLHRLLARRPDLKLIITSATIDADKFAAHFGNAPQINVSGRTYPVEIRYRPPDEDEDVNDAIVAAVAELDHLARGDILVFLPTERDIREAAAVLEREKLRETDVLPLFGRLSLADQQAVFHPGKRRRIVLATNVAETSLTVPRIKYVIDTGTARISRYSLRSKTQRLPIEPISQASANQRAGRCGRLSSGVCIRLYGEDDFKLRPEFTEPEILRTSLAAVILQMLVLNLGAVEEFPFVDAPDQRQINDGYRLLYELTAVDDGNRLTPLGKRMAALPIDPRFARIVYAAEKGGCLQEALILLAALSIADPRERPFGKEQHADQQHRLFADKDSDFISLLNLYAAWQQTRETMSNRERRAWAKAHFLNAQRLREWRELAEQLARECRAQQLRFNQEAATPDAIHRAMLAGFLDQVGLWDEQNQDYLGPRGRRFLIMPGSALGKKRPQAIMAASIVEVSRTFARTCAPIELHELEALTRHLVKITMSAPHWSKKAGNVMADESVLLYGLPIVAGRKKPFAPFDAQLAHEIFVQEALVTGELNTRLKAIAENHILREKLEALEDKTRSVLVDEQAIAAFYFKVLPESVHSVVSLEQWAKQHGESALRMREADMLMNEAAVNQADYPESLTVRGHRLALEYAFDPGGHADGVTVLMPMTALNAFAAEDFERLVPALFGEKIEALLRRLPKVWRRQLVPIPEFARALHERLAGDERPLVAALAQEIEKMKGIRIPEADFDAEKIDDHYRMNFRLIDAKKRSVAESRDLAALQAEYGADAAEQFQKRSKSQLASDEAVTEWLWEKLPEREQMKGGIVGYPALTLDKGQVYLRLHDDPDRAERSHRDGVRALLTHKLASQVKYLKKNLPHMTTMSLHYRKLAPDAQLGDDIIAALIERVCLAGGVPRTKAQFDKALAKGEKELVASGNDLAKQLAGLLADYSAINERLRALKHPGVKADIAAQLARLVFPGFIRQTPAERLSDTARYLKGMLLRLDKLAREPMKDLQRQQQIAPWQEKLGQWLQALGIRAPLEDSRDAHGQTAMLAYFWLLEEYRLQVFAQEVGVKGKVSEKRLQELLQK
ncbi:MAG: ATP-dependent RNA helicase HrpA [Cardiobacteriaceae bacterium]|nr:ATP-dependent RNA helicase HrpA [Cardiobacteriaceae bacterium]